MNTRTVLAAFVVLLLAAAPLSAANREHQQLAADIRMLQEQAQILQNMLGTINESIKAVNSRLEDQSNVMRKALADQKLLIDNLSSDLRVVREKVDDNNVRIASLSQEVEALRSALASRPVTSGDTGAPPTTGAAPPPTTGVTPAPLTPPAAAAPPIGVSPGQLYGVAYGEYTTGQWDLCIQGFQDFIRSFPKAEQAPDAQLNIGKCYNFAGDKQKALDAFDKAIRDYPAAKATADAYFQKGVVLSDLKQPDQARAAFETLIRTFPNTDAANLAKQRLDQLKKP